ncbi:N-formylglutamate amidohydrolase [Croceivirga thetidis]|uniref:N-formylglutamate amidohydrolase n=1 Tax=Croceivirga thetidis TaxID=2721623 RepID=A0ABX1GTR2_9FLAO|nr:N-formylglutamate amidohydrolase [Croceivirga thetidis]NKI32395.1 N-formylglutamate amidohydrolase [Croceivirga thetidis]
MHRLAVADIIRRIENQDVFEAVCEDYSFTIKIENYVPYVCAAVHDGHNFRKELWDNCLHTEYERWYEEDPCTKAMVHSQPIVISGLDSRFEYDLNRAPDTAIFDTAWGKQLWKNPLPELMKQKSLDKHAAFYTVVHALIRQLEKLFSEVIVFDMHSYNWKRWDREVPTWNLGTINIDNERFGKTVKAWSDKLGGLQLPHGIKSTSRINDTFQGNGYFLKYITQNFKNTLVLATEISKIYCDEHTGVIFPEVVDSVERQLRELIPLQAKEFAEGL